LPKQVAVVALQRGYLRTGSCPNKVIPVLKQVIVIPGDDVTLTNSHITVNSITYVAPFNSIDHNRQPLQKFINNGLYQSSRGYWIYGSHDPIKSWDSRYYGPVARAEIIGVYKPLLTF
jgi:conjugative transfer signal peptidase TraF